jgi:hypothetical protein
LPLLLLLSFTGCQTSEKLTLDATSRPAKDRVASYSLIVMDPAIEKDSLRHQEAERLVKAALAGNGYYEAPDAAHADMLIEVDYGIDQGHSETIQVSSPIWRMEKGSTSTITVGTGIMNAQGQEIMTSVTVTEPGNIVYGGERLSNVRQTIYTKRLVLEARRHDLRKTLPVLAAVALEHMGEETNGPKSVKLTDAEAIAFVKNPANAPQ